MKIDNPTPFDLAMIPMLGPGENTILTVIAKANFTFAPGATVLASNQVPIAFGDELYDERDGGGVRYESDMAPFKPRTDVVLSGKAYAPENKPATKVTVGVKVGPVEKHLDVIGKRLWNHAGILSRNYVSTDPKPFVICPILYSEAFGGIDESTGEYYSRNLSGKGFYSHNTKAKLTGRCLPRIEDPGRPIRSPKDHPPPVGFGFYQRAWQPRATYAGTYDKAWQAQRSPQRPSDFDFQYYNGAHPDLQAKSFLVGNESVELTNLTPEGHVQFNLPGVRPLCIVRRVGNPETENVRMNLDTVFFEPDKRDFCLVWRGSAPLSQLSDAEIEQASLSVQPLRPA